MRRSEALEAILGEARVAKAVTTLNIAAAVGAPMIVQLMGWPGMVGVLAPLTLASLGILWAQRLELQIRHLPMTLLAFVGFATISVLWSRYPLEALGGVLYMLAFGVLAVFIAMTRDLAQVIRAVGSVLRTSMLVSLALEVLSGIVIDAPFPDLGIHGNITRFGPLQGIFHDNDMLGLMAALTVVTTAVEIGMRSLSRLLAVIGIASAAFLVYASDSVVAWGALTAGVFVHIGLVFVAKAAPSERASRLLAVIIAGALVTVTAWTMRVGLISQLGGLADGIYRLDLWRRVMALYEFNPIIGRGFLGRWNLDVAPYNQFEPFQSRVAVDSANAYLDVLFQLGYVGLALMLFALLAALIRGWLLASARRAVTFRWPAIVLTVLTVASIGMSSILWEAAWLLFVVCAVKVSHEISWRSAFDPLRQTPKLEP